MEPLKTTVASLHALAAARGLEIASTSPLAAAPRGPAAPATLPDELEESLYIAAAPDALVRIRITAPGTAEERPSACWCARSAPCASASTAPSSS